MCSSDLDPPALFFFLLVRSFSFYFSVFLFKQCSKLIIWGIKIIPKIVKLVLMESSSNFQCQHSTGSVFCKSCQCNFVERQYNAYYVTICNSINLSNYTFPNFMKLICLDSLLRIEGNHQAGLVIWKHFKCILKMGREYDI